MEGTEAAEAEADVRIFFVVLVSIYSYAASAGDASPFRTAYDNCVYGSAYAQINLLPAQYRRQADMSMIAETAFQACATEERVLFLFAESLNRSGTLNTQMMMTAVKIQIKRDLQAVAANPEAYAKAK